MSVQVAQEAPCPTKQDVLNLIPRHEIRSIFRRIHLNREKVIGFIGLRGDGKSASCASLGLIDFMFWGKKVWSNMGIKCDIEISDEIARNYSLKSGGVAHFVAEPLDKQVLLKLDDRYRDGCLVIEEINIQYSNVRRSMANTNIDFNMVVQELRHLETSLIYNVIDEMFIDSQLRALTDAFIKVEDTAYNLENLARRKEPGLDFKWLIYPMSPAVAGREQSYYITKKPLDPMYFHFGRFRGIYDDKEFQHKGIYSESRKTRELPSVSVESSEEMKEKLKKWGWLAEKAISLRDSGVELLSGRELAQKIGSPLTEDVKAALQMFGIEYDRFNQAYRISDYDLEDFKVSDYAPVRESVPA